MVLSRVPLLLTLSKMVVVMMNNNKASSSDEISNSESRL